MADTVHLGLPYLAPAQAQKHVTHNEALRRLDALVQLAVINAAQSAPPGAPVEGARYIVGASPTGAFVGHAGHVAAYLDGAWVFLVPEQGWIAYDLAGGAALVRGASSWGPLGTAAASGVGFTPTGGVSATNVQAAIAELDAEKQGPDATLTALAALGTAADRIAYTTGVDAWAETPLTATARSLLDDGSTSAMRTTLGLAIGTDVAPVASPALTGTPTAPTAADGTNTTQIATTAHVASGYVAKSLLTTRGDIIARGASAPQRLALGAAGTVLGSDGTDAVWVPARERLTANRTYYVRTDGSNSNNGLSDSAGGAFLTIQYAYNLIRSTLDLAGFVVTIQLGDGTYTAGVSLTGALVGGLGSYLILKGNAGTPSNVVISTTSASCVLAGKGAYIKVQDLKLQTTTAGDGLGAYEFGQMEFANVVFGACASFHVEAWRYGTVTAVGSYTIAGGATAHLHAYSMAYISLVSLTVTLTGTPAFSSWFTGNSQSNIACAAVTFSGSATGTRYLVHKNGVTDTSGGGANFFPGNAAGSAATGGVYA